MWGVSLAVEDKGSNKSVLYIEHMRLIALKLSNYIMLVNLCWCMEQKQNSVQPREELGDWFVSHIHREEWMSFATYRECVTRCCQSQLTALIPHPHETNIVPWRYAGIYLCQSTTCLSRKACRECAIHFSQAETFVNTSIFFILFLGCGRVGKNVGRAVGTGCERASKPPSSPTVLSVVEGIL